MRFQVNKIDYASKEVKPVFETGHADIAELYASFGKQEANQKHIRAGYTVATLDPLPTPDYDLINLLPNSTTHYVWDRPVVEYVSAVAALCVDYRQTELMTGQVTEHCGMRLSRWNQYIDPVYRRAIKRGY